MIARPVGCRFWTVTDVVEWIKVRAPEEDAPAAARWWLACRNAEALRDLSRRELAETVLDGLSPITDDDVTNELQTPHEDGESVAVLDGYVESDLREHFGIR